MRVQNIHTRHKSGLEQYLLLDFGKYVDFLTSRFSCNSVHNIPYPPPIIQSTINPRINKSVSGKPLLFVLNLSRKKSHTLPIAVHRRIALKLVCFGDWIGFFSRRVSTRTAKTFQYFEAQYPHTSPR